MNKKGLWLGVLICSAAIVVVPAGAGETQKATPTAPAPPGGLDVKVVNETTDPVPVDVQGALEVGGTVDVGNFPASQTVNGTVNVGNLPAVQDVAGTVNVGNLPATPEAFQFHYAERKEADVIFGCRGLELPPGEDFLLESVAAAKNQLDDLDLDLVYLEFRVKGEDFSSSPRIRLHIPMTTVPFGTGSDVNDQSGRLETQVIVRPEAAFEDAAQGDVWRVEACIGRNIDDPEEGQHGVQMLLGGTHL